MATLFDFSPNRGMLQYNQSALPKKPKSLVNTTGLLSNQFTNAYPINKTSTPNYAQPIGNIIKTQPSGNLSATSPVDTGALARQAAAKRMADAQAQANASGQNVSLGTDYTAPTNYVAPTTFNFQQDQQYNQPTQPTTPAAPVAPATTPLQDAYTKYIQSLAPSSEVQSAQQKYLDFVTNTQAGVNNLEGQGRGIPLSLVSGQQEKLMKQAGIQEQQYSNALNVAQTRQTALQQQAQAGIGMEQALAEQRSPQTITVGNTVLGFDSATGKLQPLYTAPEQELDASGLLDLQKKELEIQKLQKDLSGENPLSEIERKIKELQLQKLQDEINPPVSEQDAQRIESQMNLFKAALNRTKELAKYSGSNTTWESIRQKFGATDFQGLMAQANTLRTLVLTMATDPSIKKFFGPQMSNADVQLMMSAGTSLNPELQKPADFIKELNRLEEFITRVQGGQNEQGNGEFNW